MGRPTEGFAAEDEDASPRCCDLATEFIGTDLRVDCATLCTPEVWRGNAQVHRPLAGGRRGGGPHLRNLSRFYSRLTTTSTSVVHRATLAA